MPFEKIDSSKKVPHASYVSIWAREKVGKTHTALTWPGPIYLFDFDLGAEDIVHKFPDKEVHIARYVPRSTDRTEKENSEMLATFESDYRSILGNSEGTAVIDTGTHLHGLISSVKIAQRLSKRNDQTVYPFDYGDANQYLENLLSMIKGSKLNLVITHRAREKWPAGRPSGEFEAQQNSRVPYFVQVVLKLERIGKETEPRRGTQPSWQPLAEKDKSRPVAMIESCRSVPNLEGLPLLDPTYDGLLSMMEG